MVERREYAQEAHLSAKNVNIVTNGRWVLTVDILMEILEMDTSYFFETVVIINNDAGVVYKVECIADEAHATAP